VTIEQEDLVDSAWRKHWT